MKKIIIIALLVIVVTVAAVLILSENQSEIQSEDLELVSESISIGTIHRDAAKMTKRYQPLIEHVATELNNDDTTFVGNVMTPHSQEEMIKYINEQKIDIYFDSPIIGMKVQQEAKMTPMLLAWKENTPTYHSVFIAPIDSEIESLDDVAGKQIIFEDSASTSGHFLPKYHLQTMGYSVGNDISDDISFEFSLDDDNTSIWLLEGRGDFGALSNIDFEQIPINAKNQLKIIGQTEDVPRQIVFFRDGLDNEAELLDVFLQMNTDDLPEIMKSAKVTKFTKIDPNDLSQVKSMLESLNFK
jgi:phosphonate transport system substrate-binding protein